MHENKFYSKTRLIVVFKCIKSMVLSHFILEICQILLEVLGRHYAWYYMMKLELNHLNFDYI